MPLEIGTTLGVYEVLAAIGAGGMGELWRARDTKLDRDVALKILPDAFVNDPERLARFQREALYWTRHHAVPTDIGTFGSYTDLEGNP